MPQRLARSPHPVFHLRLARRSIPLGGRTLLMGILNVTPDSFSEQGTYFDRKAAVERGLELESEGADILDIGGESTRPGAAPVSAEEELDRTIPVIESLRGKGLKVPISIDTYKAAVADRALRAGAEIVNDISGLRFDPRLAGIVREHRAGLVLMHLRGMPRNMQQLPPVRDIVASVKAGLAVSLQRAKQAGIRRDRILLDPGLGFGKTLEQNFELIQAAPRILRLGYPVLIGPSRKSFVRKLVQDLIDTRSRSDSPAAHSPDALLFGTAAAVTACILNGAHIVRVHDVRQMLPVARLADRLRA